MKTFVIETLGCKVNQFESDGIGVALEAKGWEKAESPVPADLVIINTCAVTSKAGMQSRQAIRKLIRTCPDAMVIVTGCHAQTEPDLIEKIPEVDHIICHSDKTRIAESIDALFVQEPCFTFRHSSHDHDAAFHSFEHTVKGDMTRAYLKIQDGCNAFCTYCIVPHARGRSVSMPEQEVFRHLKNLDAGGFSEVILTGIHTGMYGLDLSPEISLTRLLQKMDQIRPVHRVRLSSIEPAEINPEMVRLAVGDHIVCPHFHIPLQSGDDEILKRMHRPYDSTLFEKHILMIHKLLPDGCIGVDTLIGFPGETDRQFENTYQLIEKLPVSYLHVFPFSPRKGTPAYRFESKVPADVIKERCARMRELGLQKKQAFLDSQTGRTLEGIVQHQPDTETGLLKAITDNYVTVFLEASDDLKGKLVQVVPESVDPSLQVHGRITKISS